MIPYENLQRLNAPFESEFKIQFSQVLEKGQYILGPQLELFEQEFAVYQGLDYCAGVSNGLDAIILSLRALDLPKGSEVIVPANTYIATILAVMAADLKPVLVEPDIHSYNIDPDKIAPAINARTRVLLVVHLYGKVCNMDRILDICERHDLFLIEDCAQAHGARFRGQLAGTFGDFGTFSFYPTKNLGALGDGGAIVCQDKNYYQTLLQLRNYGSSKKYYHDIIGFNNRLDELQAAMLRIKLKRLDQMNAHRNQLAQLYQENLPAKFILPVRDPAHYDVFHIYNIRCTTRDDLQEYLRREGVGTVIHYPVPPHQQNALKAIFGEISCPVSEEIHQTTLSIPCSFCHRESEVMEVIDILNKY